MSGSPNDWVFAICWNIPSFLSWGCLKPTDFGCFGGSFPQRGAGFVELHSENMLIMESLNLDGAQAEA